MARYNPFFEKAGMTKVQETPPAKEAETIREVLAKLGVNTTLLASEKYILSKLRALTNDQLSEVRQAFIKHSHPRFMKEFFYHEPYGRKELYRQELQTASLEKLAKLIRVTAMLLQIKVYLFWSSA